MKIQIFQHLPALPKAGIFCPLPILCVAFRTFIPDRSAFRCFPLPCLSMFRPLVPMHKSAHSATHPAAPPSHAPATPITTPAASQYPRIPAPTAPLPAQATRRQRQGAAHPPPTLYSHHSPTHQSSQQIGASALAIIIQPPPPHTQASKKDCPAQEQSFL